MPNEAKISDIKEKPERSQDLREYCFINIIVLFSFTFTTILLILSHISISDKIALLFLIDAGILCMGLLHDLYFWNNNVPRGTKSSTHIGDPYWFGILYRTLGLAMFIILLATLVFLGLSSGEWRSLNG